MEPWLHELLGIPNRGVGVELFCWGSFIIIAMALAWRERRSGRGVGDNPLAWIVVVGLLVLGGRRLYGVATGDLTFGSEGLRIPNYGLAMALGFGIPLVWQVVRARRRESGPLTTEHSIDLGFWIIVTGVAGARALSWLLDLPTTIPACTSAGDCEGLVKFWSGGLIFYGGVLGSLGAGWIWCKRRGVNFVNAAAEIVPFVSLGHAIGRVGCLLTGCCYGAVAVNESPFSVRYPADSHPFNHVASRLPTETVREMLEHGHSVPMHAVQIYEAVGCLLLFAALLAVGNKWSSRRILGAWLFVYGGMRFVLEMLRGDTVRGFVFEWSNVGLAGLLNVPPGSPVLLSTSQMIAVGMVVGGVVISRRDGPGSVTIG